jgi:hypothetical protein
MTVYRPLTLSDRFVSVLYGGALPRKGVRGDGDADIVEHWSAGDRCGVPHVWGAWP